MLYMKIYKNGSQGRKWGDFMTYKEWVSEENLLKLGAWARNGLTDADMAQNIGIAPSTFNKWKNEHSEFKNTLKKNKEVADIIIENALYKKAIGYKVSIKKTFKVRDVVYSENGKRIKETEKLVTGEDEVYVPADTTAQIFWLKNRKPSDWKDKKIVDANVGDENIKTMQDYMESLKNGK